MTKRTQIRTKFQNFILIAFVLLVSLQTASAQLMQAQSNINWSAFMSRHDLIWDELPLQWNEGEKSAKGINLFWFHSKK